MQIKFNYWLGQSASSSINRFEQWFSNPTTIQLLVVVVGVLLIAIVVRIFRQILTRKIKDSDMRYKVRKLISFASYILMVLFVTLVFNDRLGRLSVTFGVIGAGVAFALQEVIASLAGWVAISLGQFYKPGDRVQLGGIKGDVIDISILRTTLMECGEWVEADLYNGRIVRIANSFVFKEPVFNYSADFPFLWDEIVLPIKYGSDYHLARKILNKAANDVMGEYVPQAQSKWEQMVDKYLIEDAQIEPMVTLSATDNWIEFTVRYVVEYKRRRAKKDQLFTHILDDLEATEGRVTLASATFHLVETPTFNVHLSDQN
ncbi:MAG: mechanosensitive ion channel family protein [Leptolyngbya sp. RL_3_1]|nr:mechanosensitive ion channel family protein [Leptolyngbya sp. RL_3_1]